MQRKQSSQLSPKELSEIFQKANPLSMQASSLLKPTKILLPPPVSSSLPSKDMGFPCPASTTVPVDAAQLELISRLVVLQTKISEVSIRSELAWMKCTHIQVIKDESTPPNTKDWSDIQYNSAGAIALVEKAENLTSKLLDVFTKAKCIPPVDNLKELVEDIELTFQTYQVFLEELIATSPDPTHVTDTVPTHSNPVDTTTDECKSIYTVQYDLPSMKQYCEKVAPSYSTYKQPNGTRHKM